MILADSISVGSGSGLVHALLWLLLVAICLGLIYGAGVWFIAALTGSAMARKVWDGIFIILGLVVIINFILGIGGHPLFSW